MADHVLGQDHEGLAASRERTEAQWRELLQSAGLTVVDIWTKEAHVESLIEAVLDG